MQPERIAVSIDEAAAITGVSRRSIYRAMDGGELAFAIVAGRRRILTAALQSWIAGERAA